MLSLEPIIKGEDGLILQILEERRVCIANLHITVTGRMMSPKGSLEAGKFTAGPKQRGLASQATIFIFQSLEVI